VYSARRVASPSHAFPVPCSFVRFVPVFVFTSFYVRLYAGHSIPVVCSLRFPRLSVACLVFVPFPIPGHACTCVVCCAIYLRFYVRIFQLLYMYYFIKGFVSVSASIRVVGSPTSPVYASLQHAVSCPFVRAVCPSTGVCESALRRWSSFVSAPSVIQYRLPSISPSSIRVCVCMLLLDFRSFTIVVQSVSVSIHLP